MSPPGLALIGRFEPAGTSPEAIAQKARDAQAVIHECVQVPLAQNQNDALASFVASIGAAAFRRSTLLKVLNAGNEAAAVTELGKWTKAKQNGAPVDVPAVVSRRAAETEMFRRTPAMAQSLSHRYVTHSYRFYSPRPNARGLSLYSLAQNPAAAVLAIGAADVAQIGPRPR